MGRGGSVPAPGDSCMSCLVPGEEKHILSFIKFSNARGGPSVTF